MAAPHLRFRHLDAAVLTATGALLEVRTSKLPADQALAEYQQWADTASAAYHLTRVAVQVGPEPSSYIPQGTLRLARPSIVALLAGYRRHMQRHGITPVGSPDQDAYAWALSLYHTVRPRQLARLGMLADDAERLLSGQAQPDLSALTDSERRNLWGGPLRDGEGLDQIAEMLRDPEWGVGMLEDIRELVNRTGRTCENYPDDRPTWGRH
jgi:hypothetical protein